MSLFKQLLILVSALFLLIFSVNFTLSVGNIRDYLQGEANTHAQDTATSLGLSLSPYMADPQDPIIKTMMNAIFDMGYYKEIRLVDADDRELVALRGDKQLAGVPDWFVDFLPMDTATATSEINSGWNIAGVLSVTINPGYAYQKLYEQAKAGFYYSLASLAISILLLALALRVTLASLKKIDRLALEVADGRFDVIENLPWTTEVKNVASSMNTMSKKIQFTIDALNGKLETMGASLLRDDLTGLFKKSVFETDIKQLLLEDRPGFIVVVKIDRLASLVKEQDAHSVDLFLRDFACLLQQVAQRQGEQAVKSYRFYGAEFAMLVQSGSLEQVETLLQSLGSGIAELGEKYSNNDLAHIGVAPVSPTDTLERMLEAAYEAYEQAKLIGANSYFIRRGDNFARDISEWKTLVFDCVDNEAYSVSYIGGIVDFRNGQLLLEEAFTEVRDQRGELVAIGPFISIAEKFAKIIDLDKGMVGKVLEHLRHHDVSHAIAVNLSTRTIKNTDFRLWLEKQLKQNQDLARQLVFALSAYAVAKDVEAYRDFIEAVHQWGARVMIKRFESQSLSPETTKQLKPDFIRLARELGNSISISRPKQDFVQAMQEMAALLDISILAENVEGDSDFNTLKTIGIVGASR